MNLDTFLGQQFEHGFDDIGNRTTAKAGGAGNWRSAMYTANNLNQYIAGWFDVFGIIPF
jgi:hypothetical protein